MWLRHGEGEGNAARWGRYIYSLIEEVRGELLLTDRSGVGHAVRPEFEDEAKSLGANYDRRRITVQFIR